MSRQEEEKLILRSVINHISDSEIKVENNGYLHYYNTPPGAKVPNVGTIAIRDGIHSYVEGMPVYRVKWYMDVNVHGESVRLTENATLDRNIADLLKVTYRMGFTRGQNYTKTKVRELLGIKDND